MLLSRAKFWALYQSAYAAGVVKGAAEMHRKLLDVRTKPDDRIYRAFLEVYDERHDLCPF